MRKKQDVKRMQTEYKRKTATKEEIMANPELRKRFTENAMYVLNKLLLEQKLEEMGIPGAFEIEKPNDSVG